MTLVAIKPNQTYYHVEWSDEKNCWRMKPWEYPAGPPMKRTAPKKVEYGLKLPGLLEEGVFSNKIWSVVLLGEHPSAIFHKSIIKEIEAP